MEHGLELEQTPQSLTVGFRLLQMKKHSFSRWQLLSMALVIVKWSGTHVQVHVPSVTQCSYTHEDGEFPVRTAQTFHCCMESKCGVKSREPASTQGPSNLHPECSQEQLGFSVRELGPTDHPPSPVPHHSRCGCQLQVVVLRNLSRNAYGALALCMAH